jgi:OmpA-OmpF porin, OOP family
MTKIFVFLIVLFSLESNAQRVANYYFEGNLDEFNNGFIPLDTVGKSGYFSKEVVNKFGQKPRDVYVFPQNSGLLFNNSELKEFITGPFAIEMYFRYDNGSLLLYNKLLGDKLEQNQGKYVHLVLTRNDKTNQVLVYFQGNKAYEFYDTEQQLAMDEGSQINFFIQDNVETTSGAVAMIKIYNYFINEEVSKELFTSFDDQKPNEIIAIQKGKNTTLQKLYFLQSQARLLPESNPELERLVLFMNENSKQKIELQGHTDNQGDYNLNIQLSKERAETIKNVLVESGIASNRIKTRGFGGTKPIASNTSESTRKLNRRVELVLL